MVPVVSVHPVCPCDDQPAIDCGNRGTERGAHQLASDRARPWVEAVKHTAGDVDKPEALPLVVPKWRLTKIYLLLNRHVPCPHPQSPIYVISYLLTIA